MNMIGTTARGIRAPIIRESDDLVKIVVDSVLSVAELQDKDVIGITESIVARAQGNYATVDEIAKDVKLKIKDDIIGVIFPIFSRNRFAICLKGIAKAAKKVVLMLSYPNDEVGNCIINTNEYYNFDQYGLMTLEQFKDNFGEYVHPFTGIDYIKYYQDIITSAGAQCEIIFSNTPTDIMTRARSIIVSNIHHRKQIIKELKEHTNGNIFGLDDILTSPVNSSGYNESYGLLGSNKVDENTIKLFPRNCYEFVNKVQAEFFKRTNKAVHVMIYGDGAYKDPTCNVWELADPVVSPGYTAGLNGTPNELKLKYLADNEFANLSGEKLQEAIVNSIKTKDENLKGQMDTQGTTPRYYVNLLGSLCDLISGSGDKGTPIVLIQGYFKNYAN